MSSRTRSWQLRLGVLLIVVGLGIGGYVAWQFWGTNWQSAKRHADLVERFEARVESGGQPGGGAGGKGATLDTEWGEVTALVRIPRFGDDYVIPVLAGTSDEALAAGFGQMEGSVAPGEVGNYAIAGHRVTHGEPLRDMPDLVAGDEVVVETATWRWTYVLDTDGDALRVPFTAGWVLDDLPTNPDPGGPEPVQDGETALLTLATCAELFHTDDRLVAFGHLVGRERR